MTIGNCNVINISTKNCSTNTASSNWKHTVVNERFYIPVNMPNIRTIQSVTANLKITKSHIVLTPDSLDVLNAEGTRLTGLKLIVNGIVDEIINYESTESCKIYSVSHSEPFSTFVVLDPGFDLNSPYCLKGCIEGLIVNQLDCRSIQKNVAIFVAVN